MNVSDILNTARDSVHITSAQIADATVLRYLNMVYQELSNAIVSEVGEDYFFQIWTRDLVADQNNGEYPYPPVSANAAGMLKLKKLAIKTDYQNVDYTLVREVDLATLAHDWDWYLKNQPTSDPIYFVADESIFIAPNFHSDQVQAGSAQLKLYGVSKLVDLLATDGEAEIKLPSEYHWMLPLGMEHWIYRSRGKFDEARSAKSVFDKAKREMLSKLSDRNVSPGFIELPGTAHLE